MEPEDSLPCLKKQHLFVSWATSIQSTCLILFLETFILILSSNLRPGFTSGLKEGLNISLPMLVAARSNAWVWGRSLAGIAGSNPAGSMDVCLLRVLFVVR
jgi:hypothetical protein